MSPQDRIRAILNKPPRQDAIDTTQKARNFKADHSDAVKKFKDGKCNEQTAYTILNRLRPYY